ncbi:DUF6916 family protein [Pseudoalteromonas piscicida]|uniref:DUF6916 family protein n=1 Tax=Pseudoalteromonas piscicida TaxID=43662 RepID=UPI0032C02BF6
MEKYTFENLKSIEGQPLEIKSPDYQASLQISEVTYSPTNNEHWEGYIVYLKNTDTSNVPKQGNYMVSHPELGSVELFMCPNSPSEIEIIFSRKKVLNEP